MTSDSIKRKVLIDSKTIAIVGLSDNPHRPSYMIASYLQGKGYRIVPVNPNVDSVLGEKAYPDLTSIPFPIDIVDVFRRSEDIPEVMDEALAVGCPTIWLQSGLSCSPDQEALAQEKGTQIIQNCCIKVEHQFLL